MAQVFKNKIVGEVLEELFFEHEVGDTLVNAGLMSYKAVRDYQLWRQYRSLIPKELEEDNSFYREKGIARKSVMLNFKIKHESMFYRIIAGMERIA